MNTINETVERKQSECAFMKKIGGITYKVNVHFDNNAKEQLNDKLLRAIKYEAEYKV